ncbi:MAG TPA: hypothetical protein VGG34_04665 [Opitutaceae bacterium]
MSDRGDRLKRQRDLLREHLAWLEKEIEGADERSGSPPPLSEISEPRTEPETESILAEYRQAASAAGARAKTGCLIWFALGMLVLLLVGAAFFLSYLRARR